MPPSDVSEDELTLLKHTLGLSEMQGYSEFMERSSSSLKDKIKGLLQQHREEKPTLARDTNRSRGQDFRRTMDRVREEVSVVIQSWPNIAQHVTSL